MNQCVTVPIGVDVFVRIALILHAKSQQGSIDFNLHLITALIDTNASPHHPSSHVIVPPKHTRLSLSDHHAGAI